LTEGGDAMVAIDKAMLKIERTTFELRLARFEEQRKDLAVEFVRLTCDTLLERIVEIVPSGFVEWLETHPQRLTSLLGTGFDLQQAKLLYYDSSQRFKIDMETQLNSVFATEDDPSPILITQSGRTESIRSFDLVIGGRIR